MSAFTALDSALTSVDTHSISSLKAAAATSRVEARLPGQIDSLARKETRDGKPFFELSLADAEGKLTLRAWSDSPAFAMCEGLAAGEFVEITGEFGHSASYGVESKRWTCAPLPAADREALLAGPPELRARQNADFDYIRGIAAGLADPRFRGLTALYLLEYGDRFRRTAAARQNHHARRGGLVEHVAQMMRSADAITGVYPALNRDLLLTAVLFHDAGKLWENSLPADGFVMPFDERGEMLGHITIGIELVNALWRKLLANPDAALWSGLAPASEDARLHLLHLIASHHGELQFGSPVVPKTPEAWALHYVDNLDAKMEMFAVGYTTARHLAPRIQERVWPLPGHLVAPLPRFVSAEGGAA
ncbi:MAG: HD domain-containing protein [Chthoniobacteraceae bacterium]